MSKNNYRHYRYVQALAAMDKPSTLLSATPTLLSGSYPYSGRTVMSDPECRAAVQAATVLQNKYLLNPPKHGLFEKALYQVQAIFRFLVTGRASEELQTMHLALSLHSDERDTYSEQYVISKDKPLASAPAQVAPV